MKMNQLFSYFLVLSICLIGTKANSQCIGLLDTGEPCDETYLFPNSTFILDVGGYSISFVSQGTMNGNEVYVVPSPGLSIFLEDTPQPYDNAALLPLGTDVSSLPLSGFTSSPLFMFAYSFTSIGFGPWGEGATGYLGLMTDDGRFGFVNLMDCGVLQCNTIPYHFIVPERGISEAVQPGATTGDCESLIAEFAIPTLGQWGLILISMLVLILGVVAIKSPSTKESFN